jgi:hypothetical protein
MENTKRVIVLLSVVEKFVNSFVHSRHHCSLKGLWQQITSDPDEWFCVIKENDPPLYRRKRKRQWLVVT